MITPDLLEERAAPLREAARAADNHRVEAALNRPRPTLTDLAVLLTPHAEPYIERMAQRSRQITRRRFGKTMQMYVPLYLSNECDNDCVYCGFRRSHRVERRTLTVESAAAEAVTIRRQRFRHLLLLTGESPDRCGLDYIETIVSAVRPGFDSIGIEVFPMEESEYARLIRAGVDSMTVYQETYRRERYAEVHPVGRKRDYLRRLQTPDRAGRAGMRKINIGALLGLSAFLEDMISLAVHLDYLIHTYWKSSIAVSFPRINPVPGDTVSYPVSDVQMVQAITAFRLAFPDSGIVLSTREPARLRDHLFPLGVTQTSAGSVTSPGGYTAPASAAAQFDISDNRSPREVADHLLDAGFDPVWKDWDRTLVS